MNRSEVEWWMKSQSRTRKVERLMGQRNGQKRWFDRVTKNHPGPHSNIIRKPKMTRQFRETQVWLSFFDNHPSLDDIALKRINWINFKAGDVANATWIAMLIFFKTFPFWNMHIHVFEGTPQCPCLQGKNCETSKRETLTIHKLPNLYILT